MTTIDRKPRLVTMIVSAAVGWLIALAAGQAAAQSVDAAANTGTAGDRLTGLTVIPACANNLAQAAVGLPNVIYRKTIFSVFGQYALNKKADVRIELAHDRAKFDDWIWGIAGNPFVFSDTTTVNQHVNQNVTFVGTRYIYWF